MCNRAIIPLITLLFALVAPAWAAESGCKGVTPSTETASGESLKVYIDPVTGELISKPPPGEQLEASVKTSQAPASVEIRQEVRPDGSVVADIGDRFITELRVEIVDGKAVTCHRAGTEPRSLNTETGDQLKKLPDDGR